MQGLGRGAALASLSAVCFAGCSSPDGEPVNTDGLYGETAVQSPLYEELTTNNDSNKLQDTDRLTQDQNDGLAEDDSTIGTPMWGHAEPLSNGNSRMYMYENIDGFELDEEASFAVIEADCHTGRIPKIGAINQTNSGAQYTLSCERDGATDNRPVVLKESVDFTKSYEDMMPTNPNESVAIVAYHGDLTFQHIQDGNRTIIELGNPSDLEIAQISISE